MRKKVPSRKQMVIAARKLHQNWGLIEIDECAKVSRAKGNPDKGAYVQAWVWVHDDEATYGV